MSNLWKDLEARGEKAIDDLCASETTESQQLEFKSKSNPKSAELNRDDRQNLGKSLSALSNATGGVLIFGIEPARKGEELSAGNRPQSAQSRHSRIACTALSVNS